MKIEIHGGRLLEHIFMVVIGLVILTPIITLTIGLPAYFLSKHTFLTVDASIVAVLAIWLVLLLADDYIDIER